MKYHTKRVHLLERDKNQDLRPGKSLISQLLLAHIPRLMLGVVVQYLGSGPQDMVQSVEDDIIKKIEIKIKMPMYFFLIVQRLFPKNY